MFTRPSDIRPLIVLAFTASTLVASQAEAGRVRVEVGPELPIHVLNEARQISMAAMDADGHVIDAERVFQGDASPSRNVANAVATSGSGLSTLPSSDDLDASGTGELRGKELLRAMADLPQVGGTSDSSSLSLEFWDDATSARSAVDDRATGAAEFAVQGHVRAGAHSNVMIPLPMAAWSGLSVLGGMGFAAGVRRVARRGR
jgi:hypothetical protein